MIDERGGSPFWDGVAGRFFGMNFQEADYFNAINGNQFIADLMVWYHLSWMAESMQRSDTRIARLQAKASAVAGRVSPAPDP